MATEPLPQSHRALVIKSRGQPLVVEVRPLPQLTSGSALVRNLNVPLVSYSREVWSGKRGYPFPTPSKLSFPNTRVSIDCNPRVLRHVSEASVPKHILYSLTFVHMKTC